MKIYIPPFEPMLKANEHLRRPGFELDLGDDIVQVTRCKECKHKPTCKHALILGINGYCSEGERRETL